MWRAPGNALAIAALAGAVSSGAAGMATGDVAANAGEPAGRNRLGTEKSPYLRQHAGNPVWWWTWTPEALAEAKRLGKPIFLSIGYSTCHWCHVMERESFSQADVAVVLNASFVAIKVDREERPDLDEVYVHAVESMTGAAGWPLNVLLTPEGKPFFGGTYVPREKLVALLSRAAADWKKDRRHAESIGAEVSVALARQMRREAAGRLDPALLLRFAKAQESAFDWKNGGPSGAPKFPPAYALRLLLRIHRRSGNERALAMVTRTLDAMAQGGIYDQVGGGFHRYSTDERWRVPHFEKTLYDQAALVQAYVEAFEATGNPEYARVAREVLDYVLRDLTGPDGGFYTAEDADSEGEEGRFYVWTEAELRQALPPALFDPLRAALGVTTAGDMPGGRNVLHRAPAAAASGDALFRGLETLRHVRAGRPRPARDDKVLADWNGLMIAAMAKGGRVLGEPRYVEGAARAARFVMDRLGAPGGALRHSFRGGAAAYAGNLDDYAFLLDGLVELYESDFDAGWLARAATMQAAMEARFLAPEGNYHFTDGTDPSLLVRESRTTDNVVPAGNSVAALALLRLADLRVDAGAARRAQAILAATPRDVERFPEGFPMLLMALDYASDRSKEVAIAGDAASPAARALAAAVRAGFNPNVVVAVGPPEGSTVALLDGKPLRNGLPTAYVCERQVCRAPTTDAKTAADLAHAFEPLHN